MTLINLIIVLAVLGFALFLILQYIPMPEPVKKVIIAVAVLALVVLVLQFAGVGDFNIGHGKPLLTSP